jgi:hypothetical protein
LRCRGGPNKCLMQIADIVLLRNKAAEVLDKENRVGFDRFDLYSGIANLRARMLKFCIQICKQFEKCLCSMIPTHRNVPAANSAGDGKHPTTFSIPGLLVDARAKGKKDICTHESRYAIH